MVRSSLVDVLSAGSSALLDAREDYSRLSPVSTPWIWLNPSKPPTSSSVAENRAAPSYALCPSAQVEAVCMTDEEFSNLAPFELLGAVQDRQL